MEAFKLVCLTIGLSVLTFVAAAVLTWVSEKLLNKLFGWQKRK